MGTCFDILTKPVPLVQRHVDVFRHKVIMGAHKKFAQKKKVHMNETQDSQGSVEPSADLDYHLEIPIDDPS
jgi:hypothetical protein